MEPDKPDAIPTTNASPPPNTGPAPAQPPIQPTANVQPPSNPAPVTTVYPDSTPAANVSPGQVVSGGFEPAPSPLPQTNPPQDALMRSELFSGQNGAPPNQTTVAASYPKSGRGLPKWAIAVIAIVILLGGAAAYYFGYRMNPSVIYGQSLGNTGKGYDKLIDYVDQQSKVGYKGYTGDGSYKFESASFSTDGKLGFKAGDNNSQLTFDIGAGVSRVEADLRFIKSKTSTPDIYVKASGLKGLGGVFGTPEIDASLSKIDDSWIVIDHTLIDNFNKSMSSDTTSMPEAPTREQILDEARAFGKVNQEYLYSTKKDKAVLKVVKKHGFENVDGRKLYHYEVGLQKDNVKKYVQAQQEALKSSKLNDWIKKNKYESYVAAAFKDMEKSTDNIKDSDTFDMWSDTKQRTVYKVRFSDTKKPTENYVDIGLDYKGGDNFPFFITSKSKEGGIPLDISMVAALNTKTGSTDFKLNVKDGASSGGKLEATFNFKPTNAAVKISKPANAKPLAQLLGELGYPDALNQLQALSAPAAQPAGPNPITPDIAQ